MAIYTVKTKARSKGTKTTIKNRLKGRTLAAAKAAKKYLEQSLASDQRQKGKADDTSALQLIFLGDSSVETKVQSLIDTLTEAISSKVKKTTTK